MSNNKATGPDMIAVEMIKYGTQELDQQITSVGVPSFYLQMN